MIFEAMASCWSLKGKFKQQLRIFALAKRTNARDMESAQALRVRAMQRTRAERFDIACLRFLDLIIPRKGVGLVNVRAFDFLAHELLQSNSGQ